MEKILVSFLVFAAAAAITGAAGLVLHRQKTVRMLKGGLQLSVFARAGEFFKYVFEAAAAVNSKLAAGKRYDEIGKNLKQIKTGEKISTGKFLFYEELSVAAGGALGWLLISNIFGALAFGIFGFFVPAFVLKSKIKEHNEKILNELPDAMDIVIANVEGGLSLSQALSRYSVKNRNVFSDELLVALKEIQFGKSFEDAFGALSLRLGLKDVANFSNVFIQAEKMGGNIKKILKGQAEELRNKRFQELKRKAYQAPVKLLIPLIIFIFPVIFIVLFGPIVLKLMGGF